MFEKICSIKIKNNYFDKNEIISIFNAKKDGIAIEQTSLIYGKNGTGKSTIAKGISQYNREDSKIDLNFLDNSNNIINFTNEEINNIYVYNEDFMEEKVKFRENDNMDAIVMFGEQVDHDEKIKKLKIELENKQKELSDINIANYSDSKNISNPNYHLNRLRNKLSDTLGEREKNFRIDLSRRAQITDLIFQESINFKFNKTINEVKKDYNVLLEKYNLVKSDNKEYIDEQLFDLKIPKINIEDFERIFSLELSRPISTKISERVNRVLEVEGTSRLKEISEYFLDTSNNFCPYCFREFSKKFSVDLIETINMILNKELEELENEINNSLLEELDLIKTEYDDFIGEKLINQLNEDIVVVNKEIIEFNKFLERKKNNPYEKLSFSTNIEKLIENLKLSHKKVIERLFEVNNDIKNQDDLLRNLKEKNKEYAFFESRDIIKDYKKTTNNYNIAFETHNKITEEINTLIEEIKRNNALKANVTIASKLMNKWLNNIFLEKGRLTLIHDENKYNILCRGKPIKRKDLSNGERNVVGLVYFFAKIIEKSSIEELRIKPIFLVLDDPLSSFDYEYKLGILSFIKVFIETILDNNLSKILLFTHQLDSLFSLRTMINDVRASSGNVTNKELKNKNTKNLSENMNIYHKLLLSVGLFAVNGDINFSSVPNKLRRVLESFSTFNYGTGISQLSTIEEIILSIKDLDLKEYYKNNMYRITLNMGSHLKDHTFGIEEGMLLNHDDLESLKITTKDVLLFIRELNPSHFNYIFKDFPQITNSMDSHKDFIRNLYNS